MNYQAKPIMDLTVDLLKVPTPAGFTDKLAKILEARLQKKGFKTGWTHKHTLYAEFPDQPEAQRAVTAHIDTLAGMVSTIMENGRLRFTNIGGYAYGAFEGENVQIFGDQGQIFTGTILPDRASVHIFDQHPDNDPRNVETVSIRIDADTHSAEETKALGIGIGNFVAMEPRPVITETGYLKSRFLDDKGCVAVMLTVMEQMMEKGERPAVPTRFIFSDYEEIGHGVSRALPDSVQELLALDIGTVGGTRNSSEKAVTIVAKDSRTPYSYIFRKKLTDLAEKNHINHRVDVHIRYGSDASIGVIAGFDFDFACIGMGVDATHHYERTHGDGLVAMAELLEVYLKSSLEE